jgi:hypothetical protein
VSNGAGVVAVSPTEEVVLSWIVEGVVAATDEVVVSSNVGDVASDAGASLVVPPTVSFGVQLATKTIAPRIIRKRFKADISTSFAATTTTNEPSLGGSNVTILPHRRQVSLGGRAASGPAEVGRRPVPEVIAVGDFVLWLPFRSG